MRNPPPLSARRKLVGSVLVLVAGGSAADTPPGGGARQQAVSQVVVSGTVPDEATRQAVLARSREVFGSGRTVDQLGVGRLAAPPGWGEQLQRLIAADLRQVSRGQISISGRMVELGGEVPSDAVHRQVLADVRARLDARYTLRDGLRVAVSRQEQIDRLLAAHTIEFEPGNATLTPAGRQVLDLLAPVLGGLAGGSFTVTGHTDAQGARAQNIALSAARAEAVKAYLVGKGMETNRITTSGAGPDRPVAANDSPAGRARNRRIELQVVR